jgi:HAD superfamily hydrolase (TIGR01509 family)
MDLIVFDCDGVLVDSEALVAGVEAELLTAAGYPITADQIIDRFVGTSYTSMMATLGREHQRPVPDSLRSEVQRAALDLFPTHLRAVDGIDRLLERLGADRCVASSSDPDRITLSLRICGLDHHFAPDRLFSSRMVANGKPAPDLFLHAASSSGADPGACLVVEDSVVGVMAARAAGMTVVGLVAAGHAGPALADRLSAAGADRVFTTTAELADHLVTVAT